MKKQPLSDQHIIDCLNNEYSINASILTRIHLGADIDALTYKAQTHDQSSYFIKLKHCYDHTIGVTIQLLLHNAGIQQIISPIKTKHGKPTCHINDFTLIVYPFITGQDGFNRDLTNDQWITLGKTLRQIHEFQLPLLIKNQIKQENYCPKWRDTVQSIYSKIDAEQITVDEIAAKLLAFMKKHKETIQHLVNHAEQLAQKIKKQSTEFVLCHSDIHGGNVLLANDGALYIVDWDQPIMAPKERDLMFIGGGVANVWNNPHEEELFYKSYGNTEINKEILAYYRHERIVQDIAEYCQMLLLTTDGGNDRKVMYQHFIDMFESRGVVDIAFKTDQGSFDINKVH